MASFLMMLVLAPVVWVVTWIYASPLNRLKGKFWVKLIIRVVLCAVLLGGMGAQLIYLGNQEPSPQNRQFYVLAFLIIEGIPTLAILFYRYYQDPSSYWCDWKW